MNQNTRALLFTVVVPALTRLLRRALLLLAGVAIGLLLAEHARAQTVIVYARADEAAAQRARALARVYDQVAIDRDMPPGVPWRDRMAGQILQARLVLVLWSAQAAASQEVGHEWRLALLGPAGLVPVLLDNTPLPAPLAGLNAVDWR